MAKNRAMFFSIGTMVLRPFVTRLRGVSPVSWQTSIPSVFWEYSSDYLMSIPGSLDGHREH